MRRTRIKLLLKLYSIVINIACHERSAQIAVHKTLYESCDLNSMSIELYLYRRLSKRIK